MRILILFLFFSLTRCATQKEVPATEETLSKVDSQGIHQTMLRHKKYIGNCYGQALMVKGNEHLKGTVTVKFNIGADGHAHSPEIVPEKTTLKSDSLNQCLFNGLKNWDFPVHPEGTDVGVTYPLVFSDNAPTSMQNKLDQYQKLKKE